MRYWSLGFVCHYDTPRPGRLLMSSYLDDLNTLLTHEPRVDDVVIVANENTKVFSVGFVLTASPVDMIEHVVGVGTSTLRAALHTCNAQEQYSNWVSVYEAIDEVTITPTTPIASEPDAC